MFDLTPYWSLCLWQKGGERFVDCVLPLCWWLTKRGRKILVYMHVLWKRIVYAYMFCFANRRKKIWCVLCLLACLLLHLHTCLCASLSYIFIYLVCMRKLNTSMHINSKSFSPFLSIINKGVKHNKQILLPLFVKNKEIKKG